MLPVNFRDPEKCFHQLKTRSQEVESNLKEIKGRKKISVGQQQKRMKNNTRDGKVELSMKKKTNKTKNQKTKQTKTKPKTLAEFLF